MRIILILFVYIACVSSQAEERFVAINAQQRLALGIQVAPPHSATEMQGAAVPGKVVVPNAQLVVVSASQPGLVERLFVAAGEQVKKGQALGRLRSPKLLALQREYLKTLAQLRVASRNLERDRRLAEKGIVTERQLLMSSGRWEVLKVQHSSLHEFLRLSGMSEAVIHELEVQGRYHSQLVIESPRDGVVLTQMTVAGRRVPAAAPLYRIAKLRPLWLELHVPLTTAKVIAPGSRVTIPAEGVEGRVIAIGRTVHAADQGVLVRAEVKTSAERLRPGQFVQAQLAFASDSAPGSNYLFERAALAHEGDKTFVFVEEQGGFRVVPVRVLAEQEDDVLVSGDLSPKARIVVHGVAALSAAMATNGQ